MKNAERKIRQLQRQIAVARADMERAQQCMARIIEDNRDYEIATWIPQYTKSYVEAYEKVKTLTDMIDMIEEIMDEDE